MVGKHQPLNGHEFEQTPRVSEGEGSLVFCSPGGNGKEPDMSELNTSVRYRLESLCIIKNKYNYSSYYNYLSSNLFI